MVKKLIMTDDGAVKPGFMAVIIAAVVLVGGYFVVQAWRGGDAPLPVTMMCATEGCGHTRTEALQVGEMIPAKCPKCGKESVCPAYVCKKCGTENIWNVYKGTTAPDKCSKCGTEVRYGQP